MLNRAVISITDKCNLKCRHCYNEYNRIRLESNLSYLDIEFIENLKKLGVNQVGLSGGEPLLEWEKLQKLITLFKKYEIYLIITTNGIFLDKDKLEIMKLLGVDMVQISIDGHTKEKHEYIRGDNTYDRTIKFFKNDIYKEYNIVPMHTINRKNYMDLEKYIELMISYGVNRMGFERYIPVCTNTGDDLTLDKEDLLIAYNIIYNYEVKNNLDIHINDPLYNVFKLQKFQHIEDILLNHISQCNVGCSALRTSIYIDSQGDVLPCTFSNIRLFNLNEKSIKNITDFLESNTEIKNLKCKICKYGTICRGCRGAALYSDSKDWGGEDPLCFVN